jgi:putative oxygen-independent coproporphyrinogen III oxidase
MTAGGIYVHLPYCASRCGYCAFVVTTDGSSRDAYLHAVEAEGALAAEEARDWVFDSIYLGGGTPSLLPSASIERLLSALRKSFGVAADAEVTLEANPEDVSADAARSWNAAGVTRISVGVQSLSDRELSAVGRRHDSAKARAAVSLLSASGMSVSGDLILGLPFQTAESFRGSLAGLLEAGVSHVSVYLLEVEKSRVMEEDRRLHPETYLGDDAQADVWLEMGETLASRGLRHYEISNWGEPGRESRHNLKYWTRTPTLGLGVAAHEHWAGRRRANVSALEAYVAGLAQGRRPRALDVEVGDVEAAKESVYLGLRLSEGVPRAAIETQVKSAGDDRLPADYDGWFAAGILERAGDRVRFTERGFLVSNEVLSRFV